MPKINIYVPDDLHVRMTTVGERVNWSEVAQHAFEGAIMAAIEAKFREAVNKLITEKLEQFWQQNTDVPVPLNQPDAVAAMAETACDWIAGECDRLGTKLAGKAE